MSRIKSKDMWRVLRCAYHRRNRAIADLQRDGFEVHDSYLNTGSGVRDSEEFTIVAKRLAAA